MIGKIPVFLREIAEDKVLKKTKSFDTNNGWTEVTAKDMVDAFFAEKKGDLIPLIKYNINELGIYYSRYGKK